MDEKERFWSKVEIKRPDECWNRTASKNHKGYGQFSKGTGVSDRKIVRSHRYAYESQSGEIPDGMLVCHTCDNPGCCNPAHLFLGTDQDNVKDMIKKGRRGRARRHHRLTEQQAMQIKASEEPGFKLAAEFGVSDTTVSAIRKGHRWKELL